MMFGKELPVYVRYRVMKYLPRHNVTIKELYFWIFTFYLSKQINNVLKNNGIYIARASCPRIYSLLRNS